MASTYNFDEIIPREGTHCVKYDLRHDYFGNDKVIPMWVADMDFRTPDFVMEAIRKRAEHEILGYTIHPPSFFQSIIDWNLRRHQWQLKKEWIAFSPGVVPAINMLVMALSNPGDKIIIQPPVYHPFFHAITNHNREIVKNPLVLQNGRFNMDLDDLENKIDEKTKLLILCNPHNPGGSVWKKEELKALGKICKKHNVTIISDEIHADLTLFQNKHIPLASISDELAEITITTMAPSKTFNLAGLGTSYVVSSNPRLLRRYNKVLDQVHVGMGNIFGTVALEAAYTHGDKWLAELLEYVQNNIIYMREFVKTLMPMLDVIVPEATYLVMIDFRKLNLSAKELKKVLIDNAGIGMNDGTTFGTQGRGFQRMNVACPRSVLKQALVRLEMTVREIGWY
ncbi:MAG: MalY/PatB family protein [Bacteroidales bacterium]